MCHDKSKAGRLVNHGGQGDRDGMKEAKFHVVI